MGTIRPADDYHPVFFFQTYGEMCSASTCAAVDFSIPHTLSVEIARPAMPRKSYCPWCRSTSFDDSRGNCSCCGGARG